MNQQQTLSDKERLHEQLRQPDRVTGSELLLRALLLEGVECVFGYPGGNVLYIYDAMHGNADFRHILTRHEQGAVHAADGYARASGKVGVCIATSGPGATNLVTGIATAYMDSVPLVVITGNVPSSLIGTDAFQEADILSITMPITKHNYLVKDVHDLPRIIHEAFHLASTGRKGPVLIDIPKDVSNQFTTFQYPQESPHIRGYKPLPQANDKPIEKMIAALAKAKRPVILAGAGIIAAQGEQALRAFAEKTGTPVTTTLLGLGGFPGSHELWLGMPGMHGSYAANYALQNCDLLIAAGARFDDRVTMKVDGFAPKAEAIVHIDIDPAEIGKIVKTAIPCPGDVRTVLEKANERARTGSTGEWVKELQQKKNAFPLRYDTGKNVLKPQAVIELIHETTNGEAIITTDVGQHQMWTAQFYRFNRPRSFISSGGLGTMGFGLPAAIGAQIACPDRLVVSVNGDGGMQMCSQELAICAIHNIPVKIVIINNQTLGMIRQWQELVHDKRFSHNDLSGSPDFVKLAEAYGITGLRADSLEQAREIWKQALQTPGPVLLDFVVDGNENVFPMVTHGRTLDQMIMGDEQ